TNAAGGALLGAGVGAGVGAARAAAGAYRARRVRSARAAARGGVGKSHYDFVPRSVRKARRHYNFAGGVGEFGVEPERGSPTLFAKRNFTVKQRRQDAATGLALPDGSFPIRDEADLHNAVRLVGHAANPAAAKAHICARAKAMGLEGALPDDWTADVGKRGGLRLHVEMIEKAAPADLAQGLVWGWASVIEKNGETITDHQDDQISEGELLKAAHDFMTNARTGGVMHLYRKDAPHTPLKGGDVVESVVFTHDMQKALGIDLGKVGWLIGYHITDPAVRKAVASGQLKSFSIGGKGVREAV
ncbi:MAG: XkdF-like putative serine protease domain-containing protein, partial [Stellaceae bacterium]